MFQRHLRKLATKKYSNKINKKMLLEKLNRNSLLQQRMPLTCDRQKGEIGGRGGGGGRLETDL